jgi:hypothetical protein
VDFEQQQGVAIAQDRRDRVVDRQGLAGQGGEHRFALGERMRLLTAWRSEFSASVTR